MGARARRLVERYTWENHRKILSNFPERPGRMKPSKIAFYNLTTTTKSGGIETFQVGLAGALARRGHTVHLYGGEGAAGVRMPEGVGVRTYPFTPRERFPDFGTRFRKFAERLSFARHACPDLLRGKYDLILASKPFDLPTILLASRRSGARAVFHSGGTEFFPGYGFLVRRLDTLLACSAYNAAQIRAYCGAEPQVLWNGIDTDRFLPLPRNRELEEEYGIREGEAVVVSACRLVGLKGIRYAIEAVRRLIDKGIPVRYLVAGEGEERSRLEALARELRMEGKVVFLGEIPNERLPEVYALADVAVFPTIGEEAFGISIAEALSCGVPVVASRVGGVPEVVPEGGGILVVPRDVGAVATALQELFDDPARRQSMGRVGRTHVERNFFWDRISERFETLTRFSQ